MPPAPLEKLLRLPNWVEWEWAWEELTKGEAFFCALREAVRGQALGEARALLDAWQEFVHERGGRTRQQWDAMRALIWCAEQAVASPHDNLHFPESAHPGFIAGREAWAWLCLRTLSDARSHTIEIPVALLEKEEVDDKETGFAAGLTLEVLPGGLGRVAHHPADLLATQFDDTFATAIQEAWEAAHNLARAAGLDVQDCDGRWRLRRGGRPVAQVRGRSASGAAVLGWWLALQSKQPDAELVVLAQVKPGPTEGYVLAGVNGLAAKARAVAGAKRFDTIVVADEENRREAEDALRALEQSESIRVLTLNASLERLTAVRSRLAEDLQSYYAAVIDKLDRAPWHRNGSPIQVSKVAIPVRVLKEETKIARSPFSSLAITRKDERSERFFTDSIVSTLYEEPSWLKRRIEAVWREERQKIKRAVIIGAPGGGKSFLADFTTIEMAQNGLQLLQDRKNTLDGLPLPMRIELAEFARSDLSSDPAEALLEVCRQYYSLSSRLAQWMRARLPTEQCWLILDALDQVDERDQFSLSSRLRALETRDWQCQAVITCRTANYQRDLIPWGKLSEYELAAFNIDEIRQFIKRWFGPKREQGEALQGALERNPTLSHACRNPLILTLTCLAHEERPVTEEMRRSNLYARVLRGLARRGWQSNPLQRDDAHVDDLIGLLETVARTLFERRPESNQFSNTEVIEAINAARGRSGPLALDETATLLRKELVQCGILVSAGLNRDEELTFGFLHRTFFEYLTAHALSRKANAEGWHIIAPLVAKNSRNPAWHEVILLLAGKLADPWPLLELLIREQDDAFRHRLALAAACLAEIPFAQSRSSTAVAATVDQITTTVALLWWEYIQKDTLAVGPHLMRAMLSLGPVNGQVNGVPLLEWLCQQLCEADEGARARAAFVWREAAPIVASHPNIIRLLLEGLADVANRDRRLWAAEALGDIGPAAAQNTGVIPALRVALRDSESAVRLQSAKALERMGEVVARRQREALPQWVAELLEQTEAGAIQAPEMLPIMLSALRAAESDKRLQAIVSLPSLEGLTTLHDLLPVLVEHALYDDDDEVREQAVETLGQMKTAVNKQPMAISALTNTLDEADHEIRRRALVILAEIGATAEHPAVFPALQNVLRDPETALRFRAVGVLARMGEAVTRNINMLQILLDTLRDEDSGVRAKGVEALGELGEAVARFPQVLGALVTALEDVEGGVRYGAARALAQIGKAAAEHPEAVPKLVATLQDAHKLARFYAALALTQIGEAAAAHPKVNVIVALVKTLEDEESWVRAQAVEALGEMGLAEYPEVLEALKHCAQHDPDIGMCGKVAEVAGAAWVAANYPNVFPRLQQALRHEDVWVRSEALGALGKLGKVAAQNTEVLTEMIKALRDKEPLVRREAAEALQRIMAHGVQIFEAHKGVWEGRIVTKLTS